MDEYINKYSGLTKQEVDLRTKNKQINITSFNCSKSIKNIIINNVFTYFNFINLFLFILIIFVKSYQNGLFIFVIVINTTNAIYQEIKAKKILENLSILNQSNITVLRQNKEYYISTSDIVIDDLIILKTGQQIPTDCIVIDGYLEVNESLLTGESDYIKKEIHDTLFSGSFVSSGFAICKVISVGDSNYSQKLIIEAKETANSKTELQKNLDIILKIVSFFLIPVALLLFFKQYYVLKILFEQTIISTVAAVLGMIPEGLVLLTSAALTISVIRLATKNVLVQEIFCIESLARVNTICLDKTGTITNGNMEVESIELLEHGCIEVIENIVYNIANDNATSSALKKHFKKAYTSTPTFILPFDSRRKYSALAFENDATYYIGALDFLFTDYPEDLVSKVSKLTNNGNRVIVIAKGRYTENDFEHNNLIPLAIIALSDEIRKKAINTIDYFYKQGVNSIIISGDDPITVKAIADKVGFKNIVAVNATNLKDKKDMIDALKIANVFGRVTPQQKKEIIQCLKEMNKVVAMTGDGVNDILALKEADCSIAFSSGSDASKNASNIILINDDFSTLPQIVNEGRRVINNISSSASMYLIKTIFSLILSFSTLLFSNPYPFEPIQLSVISSFCVGIPTFFLTYENNFDPIRESFIKNIITKSIPPATIISIGTTLIFNIGVLCNVENNQLTTMCFVLTIFCYFTAFFRNYPPTSTYRKIITSFIILGSIMSSLLLKSILELSILSWQLTLILVIVLIVSIFINKYLSKMLLKIYNKYKRH